MAMGILVAMDIWGRRYKMDLWHPVPKKCGGHGIIMLVHLHWMAMRTIMAAYENWDWEEELVQGGFLAHRIDEIGEGRVKMLVHWMAR